MVFALDVVFFFLRCVTDTFDRFSKQNVLPGDAASHLESDDCETIASSSVMVAVMTAPRTLAVVFHPKTLFFMFSRQSNIVAPCY